MHRRLFSLLLLTAAFLTACASAGDRLNEGMQLQSEGRYMEAAYRYASAVDKDGTLEEARERLNIVADSALRRTMDSAANLGGGGDPIAAADAFRGGDRLLRRIRQVGARFSPPADYDARRRESFDWAIETLMSYGELQRDRDRFADARRAFIRARTDFEATRAQREASFDAEADLLLRMADAALSDGRNRRAYGYAGEVLELANDAPRSTVARVGRIQETALQRGTVQLAVLPITTVAAVRESGGGELAIRLSDDLELDYWRAPPPFITVSDPVLIGMVILLFAAAWMIRIVVQAPRKLGEAAGRMRAGRAGQKLTLGMIQIAEGNFARGEKLLARAASTSDAPLFNYLQAARAAHLQGQDERRDEWLKLAYEYTPEAANAVLLTQAELQLDREQYEQALATLRRLESRWIRKYTTASFKVPS